MFLFSDWGRNLLAPYSSPADWYIYIYMYIFMYIYMCVCVTRSCQLTAGLEISRSLWNWDCTAPDPCKPVVHITLRQVFVGFEFAVAAPHCSLFALDGVVCSGGLFRRFGGSHCKWSSFCLSLLGFMICINIRLDWIGLSNSNHLTSSKIYGFWGLKLPRCPEKCFSMLLSTSSDHVK